MTFRAGLLSYPLLATSFAIRICDGQTSIELSRLNLALYRQQYSSSKLWGSLSPNVLFMLSFVWPETGDSANDST